MASEASADSAATEYSLRYALGSASATVKAVKSLASSAAVADFSRKWQADHEGALE
jgi:hypothetical protein